MRPRRVLGPVKVCILGILWSVSDVRSLTVTDPSSESLSLFPDDPYVHNLQASTFNTTVLHAERSWLLLFYLSWCGHCISYAPLFKEIAQSMAGWNSVIGVGAINCAAEENRPICTAQNISGFPALKVIPPNTSNTVDQGLNPAERDKAFMRSYLAKKLTEWSSHPNLKPLLGIDSDVPDRCFLLCSKSTSVGQIILDLLPSSEVCVRQLSYTLCSPKYLNAGDGLSKVLLRRVNGDVEILGSSEEFSKVEDMIRQNSLLVGLVSTNQVLESKNLPIVGTAEQSPRGLSRSLNASSAVAFDDLLYALHYSLTQEIPARTEYTRETLEHLKLYIQTLHKFFPADKSVHTVLMNLNQAVQKAGLPFTADSWSALTNAAGLSTLPRGSLANCQGSVSGKYRGYPCTLWTLFHTLSVSAAFLQPEGGAASVLRAMKAYVQSYFGCTECAKHFSNMAAELDTMDLRESKSAVLWLWNAHNKVNARLAGQLSEDPLHPKLQFPPLSSCPECRSNRGLWDENQVYVYMMKTYTDIHGVDSSQALPAIDALVKRLVGSPSHERSRMSVLGLTGIDVTMCSSLFLLCFLIILYMFYIVVVRRRMCNWSVKRKPTAENKFFSMY